MVPGEGVEPSLPKEPDFESGASTNSAIQAYSIAIPYLETAFRNKGAFMGVMRPQVHKKESGFSNLLRGLYVPCVELSTSGLVDG